MLNIIIIVILIYHKTFIVQISSIVWIVCVVCL